MTDDFNEFLDDLIVEIADSQAGTQTEIFDFASSATALRYNAADTWLLNAGPEMARRGWGSNVQASDANSFLISGGGLSEAARLRFQRAPKSFTQTVRAIPRSDWIASGALIVSMVALFK